MYVHLAHTVSVIIYLSERREYLSTLYNDSRGFVLLLCWFSAEVKTVYRDTVEYTLKTRQEETPNVDESLPPSFIDDVPRYASIYMPVCLLSSLLFSALLLLSVLTFFKQGVERFYSLAGLQVFSVP